MKYLIIGIICVVVGGLAAIFSDFLLEKVAAPFHWLMEKLTRNIR